jgi:hypothetical protein
MPRRRLHCGDGTIAAAFWHAHLSSFRSDCTNTTSEFSAVHELNTTMQWLWVSTDCLRGWRHSCWVIPSLSCHCFLTRLLDYDDLDDHETWNPLLPRYLSPRRTGQINKTCIVIGLARCWVGSGQKGGRVHYTSAQDSIP